VVKIARAAAEKIVVGPPDTPGVDYGPVISQAQFDKVQRFIRAGIEEGAELIAGGLGRPAALDRGYYCRPTVFARVTPEMSIAREEIFGPVLSILTYRDEDDAIRIANESDYGLVGYVQAGDVAAGARVARRLRCGYVSVNYPPINLSMPHGGYRLSGNGRQWADYAFDEYLELTGIVLPPH
jgi:aldehyde dehydrogenase (NAD+)